jgi:hypothetical protein
MINICVKKYWDELNTKKRDKHVCFPEAVIASAKELCNNDFKCDSWEMISTGQQQAYLELCFDIYHSIQGKYRLQYSPIPNDKIQQYINKGEGKQ